MVDRIIYVMFFLLAALIFLVTADWAVPDQKEHDKGLNQLYRPES